MRTTVSHSGRPPLRAAVANKNTMRSRLASVCGVAFLCLLCGCSALGPFAAARRDTVAAESFSPLDYYVWAQIAQAHELDAERERLLYLYDTELLDPVVAAVQLALLDLNSRVAADDERALARLDKVAGRPGAAADRDYRILAGLLRTHFRQKLDLRQARREAGSKSGELERLTESNRQLQDKINALTNIEQQLIQREKRGDP